MGGTLDSAGRIQHERRFGMNINRQSAKPIDPGKRRLLQLGLVATGFYAVVWGLQFAFKDNWNGSGCCLVNFAARAGHGPSRGSAT